ncbi:phasin family protein [Coralloluteibacterium stylophorae]|uniref:Phasin family protein n=1 Tax=Coralloluteibacterium stylophorae TaxID=1776034 RepID=A0A8J8AYV6_9GAMM|nr:phasin family protein [Coralloluteibacterium stylophorae]MBS7455804.1 phasin family protein [Coralloluteibacterium stylophorae]
MSDRTTSRRRSGKTPSPQSISDSAQQVWLAGLGALGRAQQEGARLFETLVREGAEAQQRTRGAASEGLEQMREAVDAQVGQARGSAGEAWERIEAAFDERMARAMLRLGIPRRVELDALTARVDALSAEVAALRARPAARATRKAPAVKRAPVAPTKSAARKSALRTRPASGRTGNQD